MERILVYNPMYDNTPQGSVIEGSPVRYELKIEKSYALELKEVNICFSCGEKAFKLKLKKATSTEQYARYTITYSFAQRGEYKYYFEISEKNGNIYFLEQGNYLNAKSCNNITCPYIQQVTIKQPEAENFYGGIMYHIFVDRFCSENPQEKDYAGKVLRKDWGGEVNSYIGQREIPNNEFYGGNFKGIISKLDYLKDLGVTTIYLSPICKAASNHKYDTGDYLTIAEEFGGEEDFRLLIEKSAEKNIGIIIDGVFNHTGSNSLYFNQQGTYNEVGACQSQNSPYFYWYNFINYPNTYDCWWGVKILPQIKKDSLPFQNFVCDKVLPKYFNMGIQGMRFDVIDELNASFTTRIGQTIRTIKPDAVLIGEVWEDASTKVAYGEAKKYFEEGKLNSVMNYPVKDGIIDYCLRGDENALTNAIRNIKTHYPKQVQNCLMNIIGTHDTMRILSVLGRGENIRESSYGKKDTILTLEQFNKGVKLLKIASLLQFTVQGVPCIYYGDEAGLCGDGDPFNRKCFPWDNINSEIHSWYKLLGKMRQNPVFKQGDINILYHSNGVVVYERIDEGNRVLVLINNGEFPYEAEIDHLMLDIVSHEYVKGDIILQPQEFIILEKVE